MADDKLTVTQLDDAPLEVAFEPVGTLATAGSVGLGLPSVTALPEAFERYPNGGATVAWLFIAWLVYRIVIAWINKPPRR